MLNLTLLNIITPSIFNAQWLVWQVLNCSFSYNSDTYKYSSFRHYKAHSAYIYYVLKNIFFSISFHIVQFYPSDLVHSQFPRLLLPTGKGSHGMSTKTGTLSWSRTKPLLPALRLCSSKLAHAPGIGPTARCLTDSSTFTTVSHIWRT